MNLKWIIIGVVVILLAAIAVAVFFRVVRNRGGEMKVGDIKPYGEMQRDFFAAAERGEMTMPRRQPGADALNRDFRLPRSTWEPVAGIAKIDETNAKTVMSVMRAVEDSVMNEAGALGGDAEAFARMSAGRRGILLACGVEMEVNNGGFDQYFLNSAGDGASQAPAALRAIGAAQVAALVEEANRAFPDGPPADRNKRLVAMKKLGKTASAKWDALDGRFFELPGLDDVKFAYVRSHLDEFFLK